MQRKFLAWQRGVASGSNESRARFRELLEHREWGRQGFSFVAKRHQITVTTARNDPGEITLPEPPPTKWYPVIVVVALLPPIGPQPSDRASSLHRKSILLCDGRNIFKNTMLPELDAVGADAARSWASRSMFGWGRRLTRPDFTWPIRVRASSVFHPAHP